MDLSIFDIQYQNSPVCLFDIHGKLKETRNGEVLKLVLIAKDQLTTRNTVLLMYLVIAIS